VNDFVSSFASFIIHLCDKFSSKKHTQSTRPCTNALSECNQLPPCANRTTSKCWIASGQHLQFPYTARYNRSCSRPPGLWVGGWLVGWVRVPSTRSLVSSFNYRDANGWLVIEFSFWKRRGSKLMALAAMAAQKSVCTTLLNRSDVGGARDAHLSSLIPYHKPASAI
jgi:hypothetical protein